MLDFFQVQLGIRSLYGREVTLEKPKGKDDARCVLHLLTMLLVDNDCIQRTENEKLTTAALHPLRTLSLSPSGNLFPTSHVEYLLSLGSTSRAKTIQ